MRISCEFDGWAHFLRQHILASTHPTYGEHYLASDSDIHANFETKFNKIKALLPENDNDDISL